MRTSNNIFQYGALVIGLLLIIVSLKIIFQDNDYTLKDTIALCIGFGLGIPVIIGSIQILRKERI